MCRNHHTADYADLSEQVFPQILHGKRIGPGFKEISPLRNRSRGKAIALIEQFLNGIVSFDAALCCFISLFDRLKRLTIIAYLSIYLRENIFGRND